MAAVSDGMVRRAKSEAGNCILIVCWSIREKTGNSLTILY